MHRQITTEEARAIVQHPASTLDEISAAGRILANSPFPSDRITGRRIMHELGDQISPKAKPRNDLCRRLSDAPPDFDRIERERRAQSEAKHKRQVCIMLAVFVFGTFAMLGLAAWSKTARSLVIYEQIEAAR